MHELRDVGYICGMNIQNSQRISREEPLGQALYLQNRKIIHCLMGITHQTKVKNVFPELSEEILVTKKREPYSTRLTMLLQDEEG